MRKQLVILGALAAAGCGGGAVGTVADLYDQLALEICRWEAKCGAIGASEEASCGINARRYFRRFAYEGDYSIEEAIAAKRISYDPAAASACLALYRELDCTGFFLSSDACGQVFKGLVPVGGVCRSTQECADGSCEGLKTGCSATCKAFLATGADCTTGMGSCNSKTDYCDYPAKMCATRGAAGAACTPSKPCATGLACQGYVSAMGMTPEVKGSCRGAGNVGETCGGSFLSGECLKGLYCDRTTMPGTCKARVGNGGDCGSSTGCQDGLACVRAQMSPLGKCAPLLDVGAACDGALATTACPTDADCDAMTMKCEKPVAGVGTDCAMTLRCSSTGLFETPLYCDAVTLKCVEKVPYGGACTPKPMMAMSGQEPCNGVTCNPATNTCVAVCM